MLLTWILRTTVGACAISWNRLDQLLESLLIARLLALVQGRCHARLTNAKVATQGTGLGSERENVHKAKCVGVEAGRLRPGLQYQLLQEGQLHGKRELCNRGCSIEELEAMTSNAASHMAEQLQIQG